MIRQLLKITPRRLSSFKEYQDPNHLIKTPNPNKIFHDRTKNISISNKTPYITTLEKHEVKARIYKVLRRFKVDLNNFDFEADFEKDLKWDGFEVINFITNVEAEFYCVFEENVFDNMENCEEISNFLTSNTRAF